MFDVDFKFLGFVIGLSFVGIVSGIVGIFMLNGIGWWLILLAGICILISDLAIIFNKHKIEQMNESLIAIGKEKVQMWNNHNVAASLLSDGSFIAAVIGALALGFPNPISVIGFCCAIVFGLANIIFKKNSV